MRWGGWGLRRRDAEIDEEIATHLQMAIRDRIACGESLAEARRGALHEFGNPSRTKEATRAVWTWTALEQLATDLQVGARILWRAPALSATAILLIALVIGGNTTIFSMVHGILAKPAPGVRAEGLVTLGWVADGEEHPGTSYLNYVDVAAASQTVRPLLAFQFARFILTTRDGSYALQGATVSANYFQTLAIRPERGRTFTEHDDRLEGGLVAVISERLWREHFSASPDIVGQTTIVNGHVATIVGVVASPFHGPVFGEGSDLWMPLLAYAVIEGRQATLTDRLSPFLIAIGRLSPGTRWSEAQAELATIAQQLPRPPGDKARTRTIELFPYSGTAAGDSLVAQRGPWFLAMFSIITILTLVIVCANVANLMLARAVVRAREMAVRQSLGASRTRIVRIFVIEGLVIAVAAGIAAAVFAFWTTRTIPQLIPPLDGTPARISFDFTPDWSVLGYAMLLALLGMVFFSAAPAVRTCRSDLQPLLKAAEPGVVQGRSLVSNGLVVLQLAFSVLLLTAAGLAYRSLGMLTADDLGFDRHNLLLVRVNTKAVASTDQASVRVVDAMIERLRTVPGISAVSYAHRPLQSYWRSERVPTLERDRPLVIERNEVGPGYLRAMGVTPLVGHDVGDGQSQSSIAVVINQHVADVLWPEQSPIGRLFRLGSQSKPLTVIGVAPNGFYNGYRRDRDANFVLMSAGDAPPPADEITLYVRYAGELDTTVPAVSRTLRTVDARVPIVYIRSVEDQLESLTWPIHAFAILLASFAIGSLVIAAIGQYAAMAFTMRRRIHDFAIRLALGASSRDIIVGVVREGLVLTAIGLTFGGVLSVVAASGLRSMLFGVTPTDARTYFGVIVLLAVASLTACYVPAHRAARLDPMQALREE
jgi:predicted permease